MGLFAQLQFITNLLYIIQVAEWATRAFFKYGESVSHHPSPASVGSHPAETSATLGGTYLASPGRPGYGSPGFVTSTPQTGVGMGQAVVRAELTSRSSKHDGLCLYFARILE